MDPDATLRDLAALRERTEERIAGLEHDIAAIIAQVTLSPPDDEHDPEGATTAFERQQSIALLGAARTSLDEITAAEERVAAGTYGTCVRCGGDIGEPRLTARPTASTCVACADVSASSRGS